MLPKAILGPFAAARSRMSVAAGVDLHVESVGASFVSRLCDIDAYEELTAGRRQQRRDDFRTTLVLPLSARDIQDVGIRQKPGSEARGPSSTLR